jgi:hypothetical protein
MTEASATMYYEGLGTYVSSPAPGSLTKQSSVSGTIDWSLSSSPPSGITKWSTLTNDGYSIDENGKYYNYISGNVRWSPNAQWSTSNTLVGRVLASDTDPTYKGGQKPGSKSSMYLMVTSSNPWQLCYCRAVAGDTSAYFKTSIVERTTHVRGLEKNLDISLEVIIDPNGGNYAATRILSPFSSSIMEPGAYKLAFTYGKDFASLNYQGSPGIFTQQKINQEIPAITSVSNAKTAITTTSTSNVNSLASRAVTSQTTNFSTTNNTTVVPAAAYARDTNFNVQTRTSPQGVDRAFISNITINFWDAVVMGAKALDASTAARIGANNYPRFRKILNDNRAIESTVSNFDVANGNSSRIYGSYNFGLSPIIRGWKHGLYSGLPTKSTAVFRRDRFGQLRDMLEQRAFSKFYYESTVDPMGNGVPATTPVVDPDDPLQPGTVSDAPVSVLHVKLRYTLDDGSTNTGRIYAETVAAESTLSHNLSTEATSSFPFTDGIARVRSEKSYASTGKTSDVIVARVDPNLKTIRG